MFHCMKFSTFIDKYIDLARAKSKALVDKFII